MAIVDLNRKVEQSKAEEAAMKAKVDGVIITLFVDMLASRGANKDALDNGLLFTDDERLAVLREAVVSGTLCAREILNIPVAVNFGQAPNSATPYEDVPPDTEVVCNTAGD